MRGVLCCVTSAAALLYKAREKQSMRFNWFLIVYDSRDGCRHAARVGDSLTLGGHLCGGGVALVVARVTCLAPEDRHWCVTKLTDSTQH